MHSDDRSKMNHMLVTGIHPSLVLDELMARWNGRWLMSGEEVRCRQCHAPQWPSNAHDPVAHRSGCVQEAEQHPWQDLAELLRTLPMVPL